ncbi:MAG: tail fiber domain-containing protein [Curvibacter lanceolatus]|uniref:tail fiber domain-containing protein n=1 Tax=Curvibacter lanceolatus TaxID=86182 RepID=UPI002354F590|nr:tail fiber domain-containing protein [Curvibacter lanceolatus]MBV5291307.1 tail fiber domain-containing protein [Curvibacter lanceolatus]
MFEMLPLGAFEPRPGGGMRFHGGKGSSAPAPDPRLVDAQVKSMGIQDDVIQRMMAQSDEMQPIQKEQLQFGLDSAKTAFQQSQDDRAYALERRGQLTGLQDKMISDAKSFDSGARGNELANQAQADVGQQFANSRDQTARSMARMGINPNSGKSLAINGQLGVAEAAAKAGVSSSARESARAEGYALTDRASNALAGYPSMGMGTTGAAAGFGASGVGLANASLAGRTAGYGLAAQVAGQMGTNATGMYGQQANYQTQAQQAQNGLWGSLGTIGGMALSAWAKSDVNAKEDIQPVDGNQALQAIRKIPISKWNYKPGEGDGGEHVGPMAQDVQSQLGDQVAPGGKAIDLISMNGIAMAAIKALDKKVSSIVARRGTKGI